MDEAKKESMKKVITTFHNEGRATGEAAANLVRKSTAGLGEQVRRAGVAFKEGSTTNKLTIVGGISTGMTFALTGMRTLRNALKKDENGKRDYASAALGTAELVGGGFVAALFWERLQMAGGIAGDTPAAKNGQSR